ncbi:acetyl-CoA carboxylase biotin carboxylase subunit [Marinobacterium aestuariivivens]
MQKVLIANRGEIACRIISSCKKLGLATVAVYSEADKDALHVEMADEAYLLGPAMAKESYLNADKVLQIALECSANAIHPGYGFLAENSRFAEAVAKAGLSWIGPRPHSIEDMGDKERARDIAKASGLPVLPGSPRFTPGDLAGLESAAEEVGYPLLVKASAGGGGIGMRLVESAEKLRSVAEATQSMSEKSFGDGTIYLERYIPRARHVEVQVFGFGEGHAVHLYERDCSLQRRYQKVIEESPAPALPDAVRQKMVTAASALCHHQRYLGAGTVEFIVDADTFEFYFLEMNTRIQVEHPVTEMNTDLDLVAMQVDLIRGSLSSFDQRDVRHQGHSIECRLYAENPDKNFMPSPGTLEVFELPEQGHGLRIDCGFRQGDQISFYYDPMIAKIICHATNRENAIDKMLTALDLIHVEGVKTNIEFLKRCLAHESFREGRVFTGFIDTHQAELLGS